MGWDPRPQDQETTIQPEHYAGVLRPGDPPQPNPHSATGSQHYEEFASGSEVVFQQEIRWLQRPPSWKCQITDHFRVPGQIRLQDGEELLSKPQPLWPRILSNKHGVKATRPEPPKSNSKLQYSANTPRNRVMRPCSLCMIKGFQDDHFALSRLCGAAMLSTPNILKIITDNHLCPTCTLAHDPIYKCHTTYKDGRSKVCTKGCMHGGSPVHHRALYA